MIAIDNLSADGVAPLPAESAVRRDAQQQHFTRLFGAPEPTKIILGGGSGVSHAILGLIDCIGQLAAEPADCDAAFLKDRGMDDGDVGVSDLGVFRHLKEVAERGVSGPGDDRRESSQLGQGVEKGLPTPKPLSVRARSLTENVTGVEEAFGLMLVGQTL